jgi:methyl-coenzyme M reductase subunit D
MSTEENKLNTEEEKCEIIDLKIFPHRFLKPETAEKVLNKIFELDGLIRGIVHGPSLPKTVYYGPARGTPVNHQYRKSIKIKTIISFQFLISKIRANRDRGFFFFVPPITKSYFSILEAATLNQEC